MDKGLAPWLQRLGYAVSFRANGWWECLVSREGERWFGAGVTAEDAFADAMAKALPSAAARAAVAEALARQSGIEAVVDAPPQRQPTPWSSPSSAAPPTAAPPTATPSSFAAQPTPAPDLPSATSDRSCGASAGLAPAGEAHAAHRAAELAAATAGRASGMDGGRSAPAAVAPQPPAVAPAPDGGLDPVLAASAEDVPVARLAPVGESAFPPVAPVPTPALPSTPVVAAQAPIAPLAAPLSRPAAPATQATAATPPAPPKERLDPIAAIDEIEQLERAIRDSYVEASLFVPVRQRLLLTQWMARARAIQEACPHSETIEERVYALAQRLGKLAKVWWPGTTKVLALDAHPRHCAKDFVRATADELATWRDVERAAEAEFLAEEEHAASRGMDEFGWADASALVPPPVDPKRIFGRVRELIEEHTEPPLMLAEEATHAEELKPQWREKDLGRPENWKQAVGELRWLRGSEIDPELWGAAMGRLRWMAAHDVSAATALKSALDPVHRPTRSWHVELGHERLERSTRAALLAGSRPAVEAPEPVLRGWLADCFALEDALPVEKLAAIAAPLRERIAAIPSNHFQERSHRRRLRNLREKLGLAAIPATSSEEAVGAPIAAPATSPDAGASVSDSAVPRGHELAVARLLPHTRAKRVLIVSNRFDPSRDRQLQEALGFASIDPCVLEASRVRGKEDAVRNGAYDLVLAATGFLPHSVEGVLKGACRLADVPFVRVNRGRFVACLIGLQRDLRDRLDGVRR